MLEIWNMCNLAVVSDHCPAMHCSLVLLHSERFIMEIAKHSNKNERYVYEIILYW